MRLVAPVAYVALFLFLAPGAGGPAAASGLAGTPEVIDGDTIVLSGETIHLFGIDAPELGQQCAIAERLYDCGAVARTALLDLTAGVEATCELVSTIEGGIIIGRCQAAGYDLSEGMTYTGWALARRDVAERYAPFEDGARQARRGLWKGTFVTPWAWRTGERLPQE